MCAHVHDRRVSVSCLISLEFTQICVKRETGLSANGMETDVDMLALGHLAEQGAFPEASEDVWQEKESVTHCHMLLGSDMRIASADYMTEAFQYAGGTYDPFNLKDPGITMHCIDDIADMCHEEALDTALMFEAPEDQDQHCLLGQDLLGLC